jgi:GTPase
MNRRPKVFFATQAATHPPTIVLFTNAPELFDNTYQRYLVKVFRDNLPFHDVPIKLHLRGKQRGEAIPGESEVSASPAKKKAKTVKVRGPSKKKKGAVAELWDDV